jgi:hypothetical protein
MSRSEPAIAALASFATAAECTAAPNGWTPVSPPGGFTTPLGPAPGACP